MSKSATLLKMIPRLRAELSDSIEGIYSSFSGEFSLQDQADAINGLLREIDLNEYSEDIAAKIAQAEDHKRCSATLKSLDLFTEEWAKEAMIRLGDGIRVHYIDATQRHLIQKSRQQSIQMSALNAAILLQHDLIERLSPAQDGYPEKTVGEAARELGIW
jgi:hypothetical protein